MIKSNGIACRFCNKPKANYTAECSNPQCPGRDSVKWNNPNARKKGY